MHGKEKKVCSPLFFFKKKKNFFLGSNNPNRIYAQIGNAVPPPVVAAIGSSLLEAMQIPHNKQAHVQLAMRATNAHEK